MNKVGLGCGITTLRYDPIEEAPELWQQVVHQPQDQNQGLRSQWYEGSVPEYSERCGMSCMPNYRWSGSKKKNTMCWSKYPFDVIFLLSKVEFEIQMFDFCANLLFCGATSWSAIAFSCGRPFGDMDGNDVHYHFRKMLSLAVTYYLATWEFETTGLCNNINVEDSCGILSLDGAQIY